MFLWSCHNKNERMLKQCCMESNILGELEAKVVNLNREVDGSRGEERRNLAESNSVKEEIQVLSEQMNNESLRSDEPLQEGGHPEERRADACGQDRGGVPKYYQVNMGFLRVSGEKKKVKGNG